MLNELKLQTGKLYSFQHSSMKTTDFVNAIPYRRASLMLLVLTKAFALL